MKIKEAIEIINGTTSTVSAKNVSPKRNIACDGLIQKFKRGQPLT